MWLFSHFVMRGAEKNLRIKVSKGLIWLSSGERLRDGLPSREHFCTLKLKCNNMSRPGSVSVYAWLVVQIPSLMDDFSTVNELTQFRAGVEILLACLLFYFFYDRWAQKGEQVYMYIQRCACTVTPRRGRRSKQWALFITINVTVLGLQIGHF